jgi:hypothetical protein
MPRTKVVELDGAKFTIAPLTLRQVEEFLEKQRAALGMDPTSKVFTIEHAAKADQGKLTDLWREFICMGLNNAMLSETGERWKPDRLIDQIDLVTFQRLRNELMEFSGLKSEVEEKKIPELAAAAAS